MSRPKWFLHTERDEKSSTIYMQHGREDGETDVQCSPRVRLQCVEAGVAVEVTGGRSDCQSEGEETDMIRMAVRRPAWGAPRGVRFPIAGGLQNGRIRTSPGAEVWGRS